jgi:hypothetical protein
MPGCSWYFDLQPHRQNGRVFYFFSNSDDKEYPDVTPILTLLLQRFQGSLVTELPSPYNKPFEILVYGIAVILTEDNWPYPHLSASESDAPILERLVNDLKIELGAADIDIGTEDRER